MVMRGQVCHLVDSTKLWYWIYRVGFAPIRFEIISNPTFERLAHALPNTRTNPKPQRGDAPVSASQEVHWVEPSLPRTLST